MKLVATGLIASSLLGACFSTEHVGRDPRKVYMTMESSVRGYKRGSEFYSEMGFGGGLIDSVQGNAKATEYAETFRERMILGALGLIGGTVCLPTLLAYDLAKSSDTYGETNYSPPSSHALIAVGCAAAIFVGAFAMASAQTYMLDAVNQYNDDVDAASAPPYQQWQPPRFQAPPPPMAPQPPQAPPPSPVMAPPGNY